jgi:hypothetical protein
MPLLTRAESRIRRLSGRDVPDQEDHLGGSPIRPPNELRVHFHGDRASVRPQARVLGGRGRGASQNRGDPLQSTGAISGHQEVG